MKRLILSNFNDFESRINTVLGSSAYFKIDQDQVNKFAEATEDHQWIHTEPNRAVRESPFGGAIAHGYLTLSLVPHLWGQILEVKNLKMMVNYGIESFRFNQPVAVGAQVKLHATLKSAINLRGITKVEVDVKLEIKDVKKPAFSGVLVFLYHFNT
jgi:acyl dehydratase